jgi:hypothetical protein
MLDLGTITLEEDQSIEQQSSIITLMEAILVMKITVLKTLRDCCNLLVMLFCKLQLSIGDRLVLEFGV